MPKLDMDGPFDLKNTIIDKEIGKELIGNFALGFMNKSGKFVVKAVGRSDEDLNKEIKSARRRFSGGFFGQIFGKPKLVKFKYSVANSAETAFQVEQRAFESFGGPKNLLNKEAPAPPE